MTDTAAPIAPPTAPPTAPAPDLKAMTGLEQMRALGSGAFPYRGIGHTLGFDLREVEEGRVVFAGTPGPQVYNPLGQVHGGYAATLLDSACGCAVHTRLAPGQGYTTLEIKVAYHRGMSAETGEVFQRVVLLDSAALSWW